MIGQGPTLPLSRLPQVALRLERPSPCLVAFLSVLAPAANDQ